MNCTQVECNHQFNKTIPWPLFPHHQLLEQTEQQQIMYWNISAPNPLESNLCKGVCVSCSEIKH